jgi:Ca2+/Na+ antiporter
MFLVVSLHDGHLSRWEGGVMFGGLITYITVLFVKREGADEELPTRPQPRRTHCCCS